MSSGGWSILRFVKQCSVIQDIGGVRIADPSTQAEYKTFPRNTATSSATESNIFVMTEKYSGVLPTLKLHLGNSNPLGLSWAFLPSDACYRLKKKKKKKRGYSEVETDYFVDSPKLRIA